MVVDQDTAIADLKAQFEHVVAQWQIGDNEPEPVRVQGGSPGQWLFHVHTPSFLNCRLDPPSSLWVANWQVSAPVPELALVGASYRSEQWLVVVVVWKRPVIDERVFSNWLLPDAPEASDLFTDPVRKIVAKRSFRALTRILQNADREAIEDAASQNTDVAVVARALEQTEAIETLTEDDPFAEASLRGVRERERLLTEEGGTWSAEHVGNHLQLTRQAINRRRKLGTLLGLDAGRHGFRYPAWQFTKRGTISGLEKILGALSHVDPWMQQAFILGKSARLEERRPLDVLRKGDVNSIVKAASAFGEHGGP
jgi:hypothetical protein